MDGYNGDAISDQEWDAADNERTGDMFGYDEDIRSDRDLANDYRREVARQERLIAVMQLDLDRQYAELVRLRELHREIVGELYGKGFDVLGWHSNGVTEPLDSWFDENGWCYIDEWKPTGKDTRRVKQ